MAKLHLLLLLVGYCVSNAQATLYLRAIEAGKGKRVGEKLTPGFVLCPAEFGLLSIECVAPGAKKVRIEEPGKYSRVEYQAPYTLMSDYPNDVKPWKKTGTGQVTFKCTGYFKSKVLSVTVQGTVGCPKSFLGYRKTSTNVYAIMQKVSPSPSPTSKKVASPSPKPKKAASPSPKAKKAASPSPKAKKAASPSHKAKKAASPTPTMPPKIKAKMIPSPSPTAAVMSYPMKLRLVHAGEKGSDRTIANLITGFFISLKGKYKGGISVVCDAPKSAKHVTFYVNGKKGKTESARPFSIAGDRGTFLQKWTAYGHGRTNITCICSNGNVVTAIGFIYLNGKKK